MRGSLLGRRTATRLRQVAISAVKSAKIKLLLCCCVLFAFFATRTAPFMGWTDHAASLNSFSGSRCVVFSVTILIIFYFVNLYISFNTYVNWDIGFFNGGNKTSLRCYQLIFRQYIWSFAPAIISLPQVGGGIRPMISRVARRLARHLSYPKQNGGNKGF